MMITLAIFSVACKGSTRRGASASNICRYASTAMHLSKQDLAGAAAAAAAASAAAFARLKQE